MKIIERYTYIMGLFMHTMGIIAILGNFNVLGGILLFFLGDFELMMTIAFTELKEERPWVLVDLVLWTTYLIAYLFGLYNYCFHFQIAFFDNVIMLFGELGIIPNVFFIVFGIYIVFRVFFTFRALKYTILAMIYINAVLISFIIVYILAAQPIFNIFDDFIMFWILFGIQLGFLIIWLRFIWTSEKSKKVYKTTLNILMLIPVIVVSVVFFLLIIMTGFAVLLILPILYLANLILDKERRERLPFISIIILIALSIALNILFVFFSPNWPDNYQNYLNLYYFSLFIQGILIVNIFLVYKRIRDEEEISAIGYIGIICWFGCILALNIPVFGDNMLNLFQLFTFY
ncbi:MAG: hypothetical protein GF364_04215 [Candidatus Lokiarchaeota archaeon]|nr:hypothetical protein [Candidatus Lokiarchaeota archaeon]